MLLLPLFVATKVIVTVCAANMKRLCGPVLSSSRFPWKNLMSHILTTFVFLVPFTVDYSQERIAKKNAPSHS